MENDEYLGSTPSWTEQNGPATLGKRAVQKPIVGNRVRRNFLKIRFLKVRQEPGEALDRLAVRSGKDI
jgi:hypothetical protein